MNHSQDPAVPVVETTAGNYFVANYPPFSCWRPQHCAQADALLDRTPAPDTPLGIYVHIPFCRKRCHFCYFKVYTDRNSQQIRAYLDALAGEMALYADRPYIDGRKPSFIYFGGGTPSFLSTRQLEELWDGLTRRIGWDEAQEITFECEPGTLSRDKLQVLRDRGVTRLSLGIENFDDRLLALNNRAHDTRAIDRAYAWAREVGFPQINIDLIAGMVGETPEGWQACVDRTLALAPESVTIYQMEIPFNTTIYQQMKASGELTAPVADWPTKRAWVGQAFTQLEAAGYHVGSAYTAARPGTRFLYRDALWRGADLLGLGVASFGHIAGLHIQNVKHDEAYQATVAAGRLPFGRALPLSSEERLIREFVLQFKLGHLDFGYFRDKFGVEPHERFAGALASLEQAGQIERTADGVRCTREGLLMIDELLPVFFLPEHRDARYT